MELFIRNPLTVVTKVKCLYSDVNIYLLSGTTCVTNHADFPVLCLHPAVVRNVLVNLMNTRADNWDLESNRYCASNLLVYNVHKHICLETNHANLLNLGLMALCHSYMQMISAVH